MSEPYLSTELGRSNGDQTMEDVEDEPACESDHVKMKGSFIKKKFLVGIMIGITAGSLIVSIISIIVAAQRGTIRSSQSLNGASLRSSFLKSNEDSGELRRDLERLLQKYMHAETRRYAEIKEETGNLRVTLEKRIQNLMNITERNRVNLSKETANMKTQLTNISQAIMTVVEDSEKETVKAVRTELDRIAHDIQNYTQHYHEELRKEVLLLKNVTVDQGSEKGGKLQLLERQAFQIRSDLTRITHDISNVSQQITYDLYTLVGDVRDDIGQNLSVLRATINDIHETLNVLNDTVQETQSLLNENTRVLTVRATMAERDSTTRATPSSFNLGATETTDYHFYDVEYFGGYDYGNLWTLLHAGSTRKTVTADVTTRPTSSNIIRLVNGGRSYGRVEILHAGYWGTICDDDWDIDDGNVVCRMLGYSRATMAPGSARYGQGTGGILLDDVQCRGDESSILQCTKGLWGHHNCGHGEDASVLCI